MPLEVRAALLERRTAECYFFTGFQSAERTQRQALACYQQLGAELRQGAAQSWLSNLAWQTGSLGDEVGGRRSIVGAPRAALRRP